MNVQSLRDIILRPFVSIGRWLKEDEKKRWYEFRWWFVPGFIFSVVMFFLPTSSVDQSNWATAIIFFLIAFIINIYFYIKINATTAHRILLNIIYFLKRGR